MKKIATGFEGLYIIQHLVFQDSRGLFIKSYNKSTFKELGLSLNIVERYFSVSHKNVIRGMHFQTPPNDHIKLVNVMQGAILDVVLDIRKKSVTYGKFFHVELKSTEGKTIYIPKGFAHGFLAMEDNTVVEYNQTTEYSPNSDDGILYNSFGFNWGIDNAIVSKRDISFISFNQFKTIF